MSEPAELKLATAPDRKAANIQIAGSIRKAQWDDLVEKLTGICRQGENLDFKGLNVILAIAQRLSTSDTRVEYCCGLDETGLTAIEDNEQFFGELPVHLQRWHSPSSAGSIFPFAINITNLTLPAHV
jgi:hypothetical protein